MGLDLSKIITGEPFWFSGRGFCQWLALHHVMLYLMAGNEIFDQRRVQCSVRNIYNQAVQ